MSTEPVAASPPGGGHSPDPDTPAPPIIINIDTDADVDVVPAGNAEPEPLFPLGGVLIGAGAPDGGATGLGPLAPEADPGPEGDPIAAIRLGGEEAEAPHGPEAAPAPFFALDTSAPPKPAAPPDSSDELEDEGGEEISDAGGSAPRGMNWPFVALLNYASVMTLLCFYLYATRKGGEAPPLVPEVAADASPDPGLRADDAYKTAPIPKLTADQITALGKTQRVGGLEWTPLAIETRPVTLVSKLRLIDPSVKPRDGGKGALWLKVRLANRSEGVAFAPLDEGFVRDREKALPDSFIETSDGERIYGYPLSSSSDQSIQGQEFPELRPGEIKETWIVSDTQAADRLGKENTWRVRFRVGDHETETVAVKFAKPDVKQ